MKALVSVIIAVYNGEKYLAQAIESVLEQTYSSVELLVIDDGSQDKTEQIAKKYASQIRYFFQFNQGQPAALNFGLSLAKGSYIAFLDADDLYLPNKTALQAEFLQAMPQIDMVFGHIEQFISPELPLELGGKWECPSELLPGYMAASGLFRKQAFECIGLFNREQSIGSFIDWYMRATEKKLKNELISNLVMRRRIHGNNTGTRIPHSHFQYLQIVKAALDRRRLK